MHLPLDLIVKIIRDVRQGRIVCRVLHNLPYDQPVRVTHQLTKWKCLTNIAVSYPYRLDWLNHFDKIDTLVLSSYIIVTDPSKYFAAFNQVENIEFEHCPSQCMTFVGSLPNIKCVSFRYLRRCSIRDMKYISHIKQIKFLQCISPPVDHFRLLRNITHLELSDCRHITSRALSYLNNLTHVSLSLCPEILDEVFLYMTDVTHLKLYLMPNIIGSTIKYLINLRHLVIRQCQVQGKYIEHLHKLQSIKVYQCPAVDLENLSHISNVRYKS
jgi:hypothetical protein